MIDSKNMKLIVGYRKMVGDEQNNFYNLYGIIL